MSRVRGNSRHLGVFASSASVDPTAEPSEPLRDQWMQDLRQQEILKRQNLSRPTTAATDPSDSAPRITNDDEELRQRRKSISGPRRLNSLHEIVADEVRAEVQRRLSQGSIRKEESPAGPPVNKGKEPPAKHEPQPGTELVLHDRPPHSPHASPASSPRPQTLLSGGTRIDLHGSAVSAQTTAEQDVDVIRRRLSQKSRGSVIASMLLALVIVVLVLLHIVVGDGGTVGRAAVLVAVGQLVAGTAALLFSVSHERETGADTAMLHGILPRDVVAQMHEGVSCIAVRHDSLTFCFCDLVGFTKATSTASHVALVSGMNKLFSTFDNLAQAMDIMKVKTMGDAYMAVAGFGSAGDHLYGMMLWCQRVMEQLGKLELEELNIDRVNVRMGVSTGPAVSGVIGKVKPVYDFWGDTVNMASRMESNGVKNRINCTKDVRDHLTEHYAMLFEKLPDVFVKGKGRMDTYLLVEEDKDRSDCGMSQSQVSGSLAASARPSMSLKIRAADDQMGEIDRLAAAQSSTFDHDIRQVLQCVSALTEELELQKATELVVSTVRELIGCDRATLFMVDHENRELWSFHNLDSAGRRIRMPIDKGIAGWAATRGETVNIADAYEDSRFNKAIDIMTGYRTRTLLAYPVMRADRVIAVIQAVNKANGLFHEGDKLLLALLGRQAGIHLMHGTLYEQLRQSQMRAHILFEVSLDLNSKMQAGDVFESVMLGARKFMKCDRATLYIIDYVRRELYSLKNQQSLSPRVQEPLSEVSKQVIPLGQGIPGHVAVLGQALNIPDAYEVPFFDPSYDQKTGYKTQSVLCVPIIDPTVESSFDSGFCVGVLEVVNKWRDADDDAQAQPSSILPFQKEDEEYLMSFASFVAVTIRNVMLYQQNQRMKERGHLLLRMSMVSASASNHQDLVRVLHQEIPNSLSCEACSLVLVVGDRKYSLHDADGLERVLSVGEGPLAGEPGMVSRVIAGELPSYNSGADSVLEDPRCNPAIDNPTGAAAVMTLIKPLVHEGRVMGAIQVMNKKPDVSKLRGTLGGMDGDSNVFDKYDEDFLHEIASVVALHLHCHFKFLGMMTPSTE